MATFHPFSRLPLELRIKIWEYATEDRVLRVRKTGYPNKVYWSPTPVPVITRACRESRKYNSYRKAFIISPSPRYIWANFDSDVIQMSSWLLAEEIMERNEIMHLRIELVNEHGWDGSDFFYHDYCHKLREFAKLENVQVLVKAGELPQWTAFIKETYWGACPSRNVKMVDAETGMWINEETSGAYQDYIDSNGGKNDNYTRVLDDWEDEQDRAEGMKRLQIPLPRIDLDY